MQTGRGRRTTPKHVNVPKIGKAVGGFAEGVKTQAIDYQGVVNPEYRSKSVLNRAAESVFAGDMVTAGMIISRNPARFAGNVALEAGILATPVGAAAKVATAARVVPKLLRQEKLYQVAGKSDSMWYHKKPSQFYTEKQLADDKMARLRTVTVPAKEAKRLETGRIVRRDAKIPKGYEYYFGGGPYFKKADGTLDLQRRANMPVPRNKPIRANTFEAKMAKVMKIKDKSRREAEITKLYSRRSLDQFVPKEAQGRLQSKTIGSEVKSHSLRGDEFVVPLKYNRKAKTVATFGETMPWYNRVFRPYQSRSKWVNALYESGQYARYKKIPKSQKVRSVRTGRKQRVLQGDEYYKTFDNVELDVMKARGFKPRTATQDRYDMYIKIGQDLRKVKQRTEGTAIGGLGGWGAAKASQYGRGRNA